jgi:hypothetical protein
MPTPDNIQVSDLIVTAAMFAAFGIVAFMFRVEREINVQEKAFKEEREPDSRVAWADYLIISSIALALLAVITLLMEIPFHSKGARAFATAACVAAAILQLGYVPSILAHYAINFGKPVKTKAREAGQAWEVWFVSLSAILATALFTWVLCMNLHCW